MKIKFKTSFWFVLIRFFSDICLIPFVIIIAYGIKFKFSEFLGIVFNLRMGQIYTHTNLNLYLESSLYIIACWMFIFFFSGLYKKYDGVLSEVDEIYDVIKSITISIMLISFGIWFFGFFPESRGVIVYMWTVGVVVFSVQRYCIGKFEEIFIRRGMGVEKMLVIGKNKVSQDIIELSLFRPRLYLFYIGSLSDTPIKHDLHYHLRDEYNYLGNLDQIESVVNEHNISTIFVTEEYQLEFMQFIKMFCQERDIKLNVCLNVNPVSGLTTQTKDYFGVPFESYFNPSYINHHYILKRIFDYLLSIIAVIVLIPIFIVVGVFIKVVSPYGPVFYCQERIGKNQRTFKMIKFRTMIIDAEPTGPVLVNDQGGEDRYIFGGQFLRKYSIDELPQVFNILKGDMSFVGPRPERPFFVDQYVNDYPYYNFRHRVLGGITGLAQVNGRSRLTRRLDQKLKYDFYYIKNWDLILDIKIILRTIIVVIKGQEAF
ncbi:hypothetical protein DID75_03135 [Candidatus Marinamargulisbacteria bacterium SCGC AG-410-N11]|nr:hypothetical protein DID75_03135 [Candidatus Marinamargulisbacteria bacterium SCGC AG-410-N11]